MPAVAVGDVFLFTINGLAFNQRIMLTHHYVATAADGVSDQEDFANAFIDLVKEGGDDDIVTPYTECLAAQYATTSLWMQKIRVGRYRRQELTQAISGVLTASEVTTLAASLTLQTDASGRNQQAVKKIGPLPSTVDYISDGVLTSTMLIALSALGNSLIEPITLPFTMGTLTPCIYHGETPFPAPDTITQFTLPTSARSNGRRVVGRGI